MAAGEELALKPCGRASGLPGCMPTKRTLPVSALRSTCASAGKSWADAAAGSSRVSSASASSPASEPGRL